MFKIAIDGPAGSGKSTISKLLAKKLNFEYIDTGAMYRAITLKALRLNKNLEDENSYDFLSTTMLDIANGRVILDNEDVSEAIRSVEVTNQVSTPSKIGVVRSFLVDYQRKISESKNAIMDGRDIGTVVLPNAQVKIFLTADPEERAMRRFKELEEKGSTVTYQEVLDDLKVRDYNDSNRAIAPLKPAEDSVIVDTSDLDFNQSVDTLYNIIKEKIYVVCKIFF